MNVTTNCKVAVFEAVSGFCPGTKSPKPIVASVIKQKYAAEIISQFSNSKNIIAN